ncbi:hypothetical protein STEG23_002917 [Scotinomys teguina]
MALELQHVYPNFCKLDEDETKVSLDAKQEAAAAAGNGNIGEGSLQGPDKLKIQGIPDHKDDEIHYIGDDIKDQSHGSHQGSRHPQLEKQGNLAAARVPQVRRTRPRIQLGFTPRQLSELEEVFEKTKYPDESTRKDLARRLFLGESKVRSWFKKKSHIRKAQQSQMLKGESAERKGPPKLQGFRQGRGVEIADPELQQICCGHPIIIGMHTMYMPGVCGDQKRVSNPLGLEFNWSYGWVVNQHVSGVNKTCVLCKSTTLASFSELDSLWDVELCEAEQQREEHSGEHK